VPQPQHHFTLVLAAAVPGMLPLRLLLLRPAVDSPFNLRLDQLMNSDVVVKKAGATMVPVNQA
jgi:hypothetical protein